MSIKQIQLKLTEEVIFHIPKRNTVRLSDLPHKEQEKENQALFQTILIRRLTSKGLN